MPPRRSVSSGFREAVDTWFRETFPGPTRAQRLAWPQIRGGHSTLVLAPTGSGKTLAAFLAAIDGLMFAPVPAKPHRCRVLYISPLKALGVDVERNLRVPLAGIARVAKERGETFHLPTVAIRSGDTPAVARTRMARTPPDILITTPESLFLILTSRAREMLRSVETVIVDEIHAVVGSKRGSHLALSLERLGEVANRPPQRIGLSATQRPLEVVARYLGGGEEGPEDWRPRPVRIVDAGARKAFDLRVEVPVEDMSRLAEAEPTRRSIWPVIHPRLVELIRSHRSTILFVNSRRLAERLAGDLNDVAGEELVRAHHGSLAREQRLEVEEALKAGRLPGLVATSSLELGIDMGAVDLVVQIETPPSVTSAIQRIGRASHQAGAVSRGVVFPKYRGDLLATAAITRAVHEGAVEETQVPQNPLDVLAQHLVSMAVADERSVDDLYALTRRAAPFAGLPRTQFEGVLDMLSGRYPSEQFAGLRPRLVWDRRRGTLRARDGARTVVVSNAGTIPDRGLYGVFLAESQTAPLTSGRVPGRRVGELDEEMVFESFAGDVFVLGASSWRILEITRDRVLVTPAPGEPGRMPFWKADRPPRPVAVGRAIGSLTRQLLGASRPRALRRLVERHGLGEGAATNLLAYLQEQKAATGVVPDDRTLVLERTRDDLGDWRLCLLSPWGGRVHAPWALALEARMRASGEVGVETLWSDDGIVIRLPDGVPPPDAEGLLPEPEAIEDLVVEGLGGTALFAARFREAAARALLLPRRRPGLRSPLWMQRKRAGDLLSFAARFPSFPIILEAYRECLKDVFDLPALVELARQVRRRDVRLVTVDSLAPSPFSASLLFGYVANYIYDGDAPLAERRAQALSVDQRHLRELLGEAELRELLDPEALEELELSLQHVDEPGRARSADRLHDLLLQLGDLTREEAAARVAPPARGDGVPPNGANALARAWIEALVLEGRAFLAPFPEGERVLAAEDAGRFRDGLGVDVPPDLPAAFREGPFVPSALHEIAARYARTHGPFRAADFCERYGVKAEQGHEVLAALARDGRVLEGEFRPGGSGREWCDVEVLARLRRRSLARLRRQVEPAEPSSLALLMLGWQGITTGAAGQRGPDDLLDVIGQLQGAVFPASVLESDILPARIPGYRPDHLDALCAAGEVVWVGVSTLGDHDGRLALFLPDQLAWLRPSRSDPPPGPLCETIRGLLAERGACFFADIHAVAGAGPAEPVLKALWELVWAGEVTNDTLAPLRARLRKGSRGRRQPRALRSRRASPASGAGRWGLVDRLLGAVPPSPTERAMVTARQLIARHGVLTREAVVGEGFPGGFAALYPVLAALEEQGHVRRGYFLAGLGGSQFADPGAVEKLRISRQPPAPGRDGDEPKVTAALLAATDPANPYGAALPWPGDAGRLARVAGAHVVLVDGHPRAYLGRDDRELRAFLPAEEPARSRAGRAVARALAAWAQRTGRLALAWGEAPESPGGILQPYLLEAGFAPAGRGFRLIVAPPSA